MTFLPISEDLFDDDDDKILDACFQHLFSKH